MSNTISVRVNGGYIVASVSPDPDYPGIDVEFVSDTDTGSNASRPRVLFEQESESNELRVLVWDDPNSEDCTDEIIFNV